MQEIPFARIIKGNQEEGHVQEFCLETIKWNWVCVLCAYHVGEDVVDCAVDCVEWGCLHGGGVWDLGAGYIFGCACRIHSWHWLDGLEFQKCDNIKNTYCAAVPTGWTCSRNCRILYISNLSYPQKHHQFTFIRLAGQIYQLSCSTIFKRINLYYKYLINKDNILANFTDY